MNILLSLSGTSDKPPLSPLSLSKGVGGRIGTGSSLGSYVRKIIAVENVELDEDPREALLKYAKVSGNLSFFLEMLLNMELMMHLGFHF